MISYDDDLKSLESESPALPTRSEAAREVNRSGKGGNVTKMTEETAVALESGLRRGLPYVTACKLAGISYAALKTWKRQALEDLEQGRPSRAITFLARLARVEAEAEAEAVTAWRSHFEKDYRAARDFLERRHPERWGRRDQVEVSGSVTHGVVMLPPLDGQPGRDGDVINAEVIEDSPSEE